MTNWNGKQLLATTLPTLLEAAYYNKENSYEIILVDEVLTPDSSRFWPQNTYAPGGPQESFDKQYIRDYLISIKWNRTPPAPHLPENVISSTREKYLEALTRLAG